MKYLYFILIVTTIAIMYVFKKQHRPSYVALLKDDLYFYPARFPIPRPQLRPHEIPHRKHFI